MVRVVVAATLFLFCLAPIAAAQDNRGVITLVVTVDPADGARALAFEGDGGLHPLTEDFDAGVATVEFKPEFVAPTPGILTMEWNDGISAIPTILIPAYAGGRISVEFDHVGENDMDATRANRLCWETQTVLSTAFPKLFGCGQWVRKLRDRGEFFTPTFLKGLRGWFEGNYHLFTRVRVQGLELGPFRMEADLIEMMTKTLDTYDQLPAGDRERFNRFLRIADMRRALDEVKVQELKWFGLVNGLITTGELRTAALISAHVLETYDVVSPDSCAAVDGVTRAMILDAIWLSEGIEPDDQRCSNNP